MDNFYGKLMDAVRVLVWLGAAGILISLVGYGVVFGSNSGHPMVYGGIGLIVGFLCLIIYFYLLEGIGRIWAHLGKRYWWFEYTRSLWKQSINSEI